MTDRMYKRSITIVDRKLQFSLALKLAGVMAGIATLYALAIFVLPASGSLDKMSAEETRKFFLSTNAIYFGLATGILFTLALILTHRIAGAVYVIDRAIRGTIEGNFEHRLALRKHDYLKDLAATVNTWRDHLQESQAEQRTCVSDLEHCLAEGDMDAAKELVQRLRKTLPEMQASEQAADKAEAPAEEAAVNA